MSWEDIALLKATCPDAAFHYRFRLYGSEVDLDQEKLDFRGVAIGDEGNALYPVLTCMNRCSLLDMDSTGVSDEALERMKQWLKRVDRVIDAGVAIGEGNARMAEIVEMAKQHPGYEKVE